MATMYLVAWQDAERAAALPPLVVELCQAVRSVQGSNFNTHKYDFPNLQIRFPPGRTFYVVIVPVLHGSVTARAAARPSSYRLTRPSVPFVYSLNSGNIGLNSGNIGLNSGNIGHNSYNIRPNSGNIRPNSGNNGLNRGNIGLNSGNIVPNSGKLCLNSGNISLDSGIA
jgi:hypothetical protein